MESKFLVNYTHANDINPEKISKLMSTSRKGKATSNKKQEYLSNEVSKNVKTYWECSQNVIYYVTKSSRSSMHSLVDKGDNGVLSGSDVRVIKTHPDRKVTSTVYITTRSLPSL